MNLREMINEVWRRLNEEAEDPAYWNEEDILEALNDGLEELGDATEYNETYKAIPFKALQSYYDMRGYFGDGFLRLSEVFYPSRSRWFFFRMVRDLDNGLGANYPKWETVPGDPRVLLPRSLWWVGIHPRPSADSDPNGGMRAFAKTLPPRLSEDSDEPDFPREFHYALIEYALYELRLDDQEVKVALEHYGEYQVYEARFQEFSDDRQRIDTVHGMREEGPIA